MTDDVLKLFVELAEELYFRCAAGQYREERKALKGVQHSIERVLERHGYKTTFERSQPGPQGKAMIARTNEQELP